MKKPLLLGIGVLLGAQISNAQETLFHSDFAPDTDHPYAEWDAAPAGWLVEAFNQRWVNDSFNAAEDSNGYFGEVFREQGETYDAWWKSESFSVGGGMEYTVTFDFKPTTDDGFANSGELSGEARFYVRYWKEESEFLGQSFQDIILDTDSIGESGFGGTGDFSDLNVSEPDAKGWRTITVSGITHPETIAIDIWAYGANGDTGNPDDPVRFFGSFGIDHVEMISDVPQFQETIDSTTYTAIELEFDGEADHRYILKTSGNLTEWTSSSGLIMGDGEPVVRFFSTRENDREFYRVVTD